MMRKFLFVFALSLMAIGTSAQIQEGAKLDNRTATLDKGKGTDDQELTTGKVDLEAKNDLKVPGKVFISPTRPAEYFDIDFTITQSGVTFDESVSSVIS